MSLLSKNKSDDVDRVPVRRGKRGVLLQEYEDAARPLEKFLEPYAPQIGALIGDLGAKYVLNPGDPDKRWIVAFERMNNASAPLPPALLPPHYHRDRRAFGMVDSQEFLYLWSLQCPYPLKFTRQVYPTPLSFLRLRVYWGGRCLSDAAANHPAVTAHLVFVPLPDDGTPGESSVSSLLLAFTGDVAADVAKWRTGVDALAAEGKIPTFVRRGFTYKAGFFKRHRVTDYTWSLRWVSGKEWEIGQEVAR